MINQFQARLIGPFNSGAAAGGAGVATANADTGIQLVGELLGLYIKYNDAPPVTTDVVLKTKGTSPNPGSVTFLTLANVQADGWKKPAQQYCDSVGAAIAGAYGPLLLADNVNIKIDQANNGDSVDVWFLLR